MFGVQPTSCYGEGFSSPPSLAAALSLQNRLFPDVGGTSVRDGEKIEAAMWVSSRVGREARSTFIYSLRRASPASRWETGPGRRLHFPK